MFIAGTNAFLCFFCLLFPSAEILWQKADLIVCGVKQGTILLLKSKPIINKSLFVVYFKKIFWTQYTINIWILEVRTVTGHEGPERDWEYSSTLSLTSALDGGGCLTPLYTRE